MLTAKVWCQNCDIKFTVKYDSMEPIGFCPFCGEQIQVDDDDDDDDGEEDDY